MAKYLLYEKLLYKLHEMHDGDQDKIDEKEIEKIVGKMEDLIENHLTQDEIKKGDRVEQYLTGYRAGKANARSIINVEKEASDYLDRCSEEAHKYKQLQIVQFELYEQGLDDYCSEVEAVEQEMSDLYDKLFSDEQHAADIFNAYLTGFQHARNGRPCDPCE